MSAPLVEPSAPQPTTPYTLPNQYTPPPSYQPGSAAPAPAPAPVPPTAQYPAQGAGVASTPTLAYASAAPTTADATATAFGAGTGFNGFKLERHASENPPNNAPIDWAALVLAIVLPPIGLITAIVALALGFRNRGFGSTVAKVAVPIAVVMSLVAGAGGAVLAKTAADNAAHASLVASSAQWCSQVKSGPGGYTSATFGWPSPADTVPDSITAMQGYVTRWTNLQKIAPKGIATGSGELVAMAKSIVSTDTSTQTVDDASNVSQLEDSAANSGIPQWISSYCG